MAKVLIVEDEEIERIVLRKIILEHFQDIELVAEAVNGTDAIAMIEDQPFDLVILDINIPGINGLDVCETLKTKYPNARVVITTAYSKFEFAFRAIKVKVNDYLLKPVRPEKIIDCVSALMEDKNTGEPSRDEQYLHRLSKFIREHSYRNTVKCLRDTLDDIYARYTDLASISRIVLSIANRIAETAMLMGLDIESKHQYQIFCLKERFAPYDNRSDIYYKLLSMVNATFDALIHSNKYNKSDFNAIINYIERNIGQNITLNDVASYACISTYYLSKVFKREMNVNFVTYIADRRIELAKEMLQRTEIPIMNIAMELSFNEPNYFSRVFKKKTGLTPSEYRDQSKETAMRAGG
ncbi:MAG: response regulator transcription factor [Bacillota bacterium]